MMLSSSLEDLWWAPIPGALAVGVLPPRLLRDTPKVVSLQVGCCRDQELKDARNTKFRQVRAAKSVIPYVLCVVCIALCVDQGDIGWSYLEGVPARPYVAWGDRVTWKS
jgi:hypothetical protein